MADHGWNADGAAGGVATGNSDSDSSTDAPKAPAPNVVQFPGDWIGPLDELVPIDLEPPTQEHPRASSFWDGDATAVHEAVGSAGQLGGAAGPLGGAAGPRVGSATPGATRHQAPPPVTGVSAWPRQRRRGPSWPLLAGVVLAVLLAGLVVLWVSNGGRAPGTSQPVTGPSAATVGTRTLKPKPKTLNPYAKPLKHQDKPLSREAKPLKHKAKPASAGVKPSTVRPVTEPVTVTRHVTVTPSAPVTHNPPLQHETPVTTPAQVVVQHGVAAPPPKPVTSHTTQTSRITHSAPCVMSPDSGCMP
jgi:hypothetical protein